MYPECFDGIDEVKDFEYHIQLNARFKPITQTTHKPVLSVESRLKKELDQKERQGIIDKPIMPT